MAMTNPSQSQHLIKEVSLDLKISRSEDPENNSGMVNSAQNQHDTIANGQEDQPWAKMGSVEPH
jgi:hypothetical protein